MFRKLVPAIGFAWVGLFAVGQVQAIGQPQKDLVYTTYSGSQNGVTVRDAATLEQYYYFDPGFSINGIAAGSGDELYLTSGNSIYRYNNAGVQLAAFSWSDQTITYTSTTLGNGSLYTAYEGSQNGLTVRDQNTLDQTAALAMPLPPNNGIGSNVENSFYRVFDNQIVRVKSDGTVLATLAFPDTGVNYTNVDVGAGKIFASYNGSQQGVTVRDAVTLAQSDFWNPGFDSTGVAAGVVDDVYLTNGNSIYRIDAAGNQLTVMTFPDAGIVYGDIAYAARGLPPGPLPTVTLLQARPEAGTTDIAVLVVGEPDGPIPDIEVLQATACVDRQLDGPMRFGVLDVPDTFMLDENGEAYVLGALPGEPDNYVAVRLVNDQGNATGVASQCIVAGPDNDSWVRALTVPLQDNGELPSTGSIDGFIDTTGTSRWFKFAIQPGAQATIALSNLPKDYDLAVFSDIKQAFSTLIGDTDVDALNLINAEFAPQRFSPQRFSPDQYSGEQIAPDAYSEDAFAPQRFSASSFSADAFFPQRFSGDEYSPQRFSGDATAPQRFSPQRFSPQRFSPDESPDGFSAENYVSAQTRSLIAASAQFGTAAEVASVDTWNNTGEYYLRVSGKNGTSDLDNPFRVDVELTSGQCKLVAPVAFPSGITADGAGYETLILYDSEQLMVEGASAAAIALLEAKLETLALRPEVNGVVRDLGELANIQDLHTQAKVDAPSCPYAANLTAGAIRQLIGLYRTANPGLKYIVLAGGDAIIPFFRKPDIALLGPEDDYDPPMRDGTQSQASLRLNFVLTQDDYGASVAPSVGDSRVAVPDLAVGRLVETIDEMITVVDAYLETPDGVVAAPTSTLVTGYDFLQDTADVIHELLVEGTNPSTGETVAANRSLITDASLSPEDPASWTADQLRAQLALAPDIMFLAGHFSANSALAADYATTVVVTEIDQSDLDLSNVLVYSAGCHSGYNIVNPDSVPNVTLQLDWPQLFARKGASLIAGTGYQYGDTEFIEYSERLYVEFTKALRRNAAGPVAIGDALVAAKQAYLAETPELRGLHRKSLQVSTLFGLPMLRIDMPYNPLDETDNGSPPVLDDILQGPGRPISAGGLGLSKANLDLLFDSTNIIEQTQPLVVGFDSQGGTAETIPATYLQGPNGVLVNPGEPAIPLVSRDVSVDLQSLRGVGFRGGRWRERDIYPLTGAPTTELRSIHVPLRSSINIPLQLATPNYFDALAKFQGKTILHITPAQHRAAAAGGSLATLRQFSELNFDLFYSSNTILYAGGNQPALAGPPAISGVQAVTFDSIGTDDAVRFLANVVGDPSAGIQEVWVTYAEGDPVLGQEYRWFDQPLTQDPDDSRVWTADLAPSVVDDFNRLQYAIHAANGVGLVSTNDNYGRFYEIVGRLGEVGDDGRPEVLLPSTLVLSGLGGSYLPTSGGYNKLLALEAQLTDDDGFVDGQTIQFQLGQGVVFATTNANGVAEVTLPLHSEPGNYQVTASFAGNNQLDGSSDFALFEIERVNTVLRLIDGPQQVGVEAVASGVTAVLEDDEGNRLPEQAVYFTVAGGPRGDITVSAITNNVGVASLGDLMLPPNSYAVTAQFLGNLPTGVEIIDPVYNPAQDNILLDLIGGKNCPTGPVKGKVFMQGFCYLVHLIDGKVYMFNGTLVIGSTIVVVNEDPVQSADGEPDPSAGDGLEAVGDGALDAAAQELAQTSDGALEPAADDAEIVNTVGVVTRKVSQFGAGGVVIYESAIVKGRIWELGPGGIVVYGTAGRGLVELGDGDIEILSPAVVEGKVIEFGNGDIVVGDVDDGGSAIVDATVVGNVTETGSGNLIVTSHGFVDGNVTERGQGTAIVDPDSVTGKVRSY